MQQPPNVFYVSGSTYSHSDRLNQIAFFEPLLKLWVGPISKIEEAQKICNECHLKLSQTYQADFIEPTNEIDWKLRRTESTIKLKTIKIHDLESESEKLSNSGNIDIHKSRIQDIQISINDLKESLKLLQEKKVQLEEEKKQGKSKPFHFRTLAEMRNAGEDWLTKQPPAQPMLLKRNGNIPVIPQGIVALLCGIGGGGKTRFNTQLAFCLAAGIDFFNYFKIATAKGYGRVFLGLGEEPSNNIWRRLRRVIDHYAPSMEDLTNEDKERKVLIEQVAQRLIPYSFYGMDARFIDDNGLATPGYYEFLKALQLAAGDEGLDLIILDPISRFQGSQTEKDNDNATKLIALLERITQEVKGNPTVLISHHMPKGVDKNSQEASRGSSALPAGARWQMNMWTPETGSSSNSARKYARGFSALNIVKTNDCPYLENPFLVRFNENGILVPATKEDCASANIKSEDYLIENCQQTSTSKKTSNNVQASSNLKYQFK